MDPNDEGFDLDIFRAASKDLWEDHAQWWQTNFTNGADPEYEEQIIPMAVDEVERLGIRAILDLGVGDGQISRAIRRRLANQVTVVGIDPAIMQLQSALERGGIDMLVRGEAKELPFGPESFDAVVACLVFEHVIEFELAISEVARVLKPGGHFLFFLNHPLLQTPGSGFIDDVELAEQYWRIGPYLKEDLSFEEVAKDVFIPFVHRPLSRYINQMASKGLFVEKMEEPAPPQGFVDKAWEYKFVREIPRLLYLCARKGLS